MEMFSKHKLPFLLLGLGIGIILTNAIYTLNPPWEYRDYSNQEIIERAKELGMVFIKDSIDIAADKEEGNQDNKELISDTDNGDIEDESENFASESEKDQEESLEFYGELEEVTFIIETGDTLTKVSRGLEKAGIIDDAESFLNYGKKKGVDKRLRVGVYKLTKGLDYDSIISILLKQEDNINTAK